MFNFHALIDFQFPMDSSLLLHFVLVLRTCYTVNGYFSLFNFGYFFARARRKC